jgi:hypothetical protein
LTPLAIGTGAAILAWIGLALGAVVLVLVVGLLNRVLRPALEIKRYADHILEGATAISRNLEDADQLARTRELAAALPGLATAYLAKLRRRQP